MKETTLQAKFPEIAAEWHPTKNGSLAPQTVGAYSKKTVWWQCAKGHEWSTEVISRTARPRGCPICSGRQALAGYNDLAYLNPELATEWHPVKNGELTPQQVTAHSGKRVWWQCAEGHEWSTKVSDRSTNGNGCPICSGQKVLAGYNDLASIDPELAAEWHPTKNGNLTPQDVTARSGKKIWWICAKGHEWSTVIAHRSAGSGCPYCSGRYPISGETDLATLSPQLAAEWHPSKNGVLTPQDFTSCSNKKVWWQCQAGHEWQAVINNRSSGGKGCPACAKIKKKIRNTD